MAGRLLPHVCMFASSSITRLLAHAGALLPLVLLLWQLSSSQPGADPIREVTLRTGKAALVLLLLSLAVTPLHLLGGWKRLIPLRKTLGLYAFFYAALHLFVFAVVDYGLVLTRIWDALLRTPYVLVGLASFLILLLLALTSNRWAMRRLGKNWKRLHRWVYLAAILAIIHYFWLVKNVYTQPALFAALLTLLLLLRLPTLRIPLGRFRQRLRQPFKAR